jgi:hypothetical protein
VQYEPDGDEQGNEQDQHPIACRPQSYERESTPRNGPRHGIGRKARQIANGLGQHRRIVVAGAYDGIPELVRGWPEAQDRAPVHRMTTDARSVGVETGQRSEVLGEASQHELVARSPREGLAAASIVYPTAPRE